MWRTSSFLADVDECSTGEADCHTNALCSNTVGLYVCRCIRGYEGDGKFCTGWLYFMVKLYLNCIIIKAATVVPSARPFYSYGWKRVWSWPCFDTNLPVLLCKSSYSYANKYFSRKISITKQRRFVSKQGHRQPHIHSKARVLSPQL